MQDLGRPGYASRGISAGGAADPLALRLGNLLLGNEEGTAALEATLAGPTLLFARGALVALAGATADARLDGRPVPSWTVLDAPAGSTLEVGPGRNGARTYVCLAGGLDVPPVLGSRSTDLAAGMGGLGGRALRAGDDLPLGPVAGEPRGRSVDPAAAGWRAAWGLLRVTEGPQAGWFAREARRRFLETSWRVAEASDRRGLRLEGPPVSASSGLQLLTEGVPLGAVQVPASGQPIVLGVDQQTTGGYPKIASVIAADLPLLGQLRPRDAVRFLEVSFPDARAALERRERRLRSREVFRP